MRAALHAHALLAVLLAIGFAACDTLEPPTEAIVVEAFFETGRPLPALSVGRTSGLVELMALPVLDTEVVVQVGEEAVRYRPADGMPGLYRPEMGVVVEAGDPLALEVRAGHSLVRAASSAPPVLRLDSLRIEPAPAPVRAVFASAPGAPAHEGFLYPVDVTLYWTAPEDDERWWVRGRLAPPPAAPTVVADLLLRTDDTRPEAEWAVPAAPGVRRWQGLYAIPVDGPDTPLPAHALEVALLRSDAAYARFARSRTEPQEREPVGNVEGGVGIVVGISVDRRLVPVE